MANKFYVCGLIAVFLRACMEPTQMSVCVRGWMPVRGCLRACERVCVRVCLRASVCVCRGGLPSWIFPRVRFTEVPVAYPDTVSAPSIGLFGWAYRFLS